MTLAMVRTSDAPDPEWQIFRHGPSQCFLRAIGRTSSGDGRVTRRALIGAAICWLPLSVLSAVDALVWPSGDAYAFFTDIGTHARYLVAVTRCDRVLTEAMKLFL